MITRVNFSIFTNSPYIKKSASSSGSSSPYFRMRKSDETTIGKVHPTLWFSKFFMKIAVFGIAILRKFDKSYIGLIRTNLEIHPSNHFCDFP